MVSYQLKYKYEDKTNQKYIKHSSNITLEGFQLDSESINIKHPTVIDVNDEKCDRDSDTNANASFWINNSLDDISMNDPISYLEFKIIIISKILQLFSFLNMLFNTYFFIGINYLLPFIVLSIIDIFGGIAIHLFHVKGSILYASISFLYIICLTFLVFYIITKNSCEYLIFSDEKVMNFSSCYDDLNLSNLQSCKDSNMTLVDEIYKSYIKYRYKDKSERFIKDFIDYSSDIEYFKDVNKLCIIFNSFLLILVKVSHIALTALFLKLLNQLKADDIKRIKNNSKKISLFS